MFQWNVGCCCCFFFSFSFNQYLNLKFDCATTKAISCCPTHESCICFKIIIGKKCRRNKWFKFMCHTHRPRWCRWWCWISSGVLLCSKWIWVILQTHIYIIYIIDVFIVSLLCEIIEAWTFVCVCVCVSVWQNTVKPISSIKIFEFQPKRIQIKFHGYVLKWVCLYMDHCLFLLRACVRDELQ